MPFLCSLLTVPCDQLPSVVSRDPTAYIVNTDPAGEPGRHWLAIWTEGNKCELMDSYGVPNSKDFISNDHKIGQWMKNLVIDAIKWR